MFSYNGMSEDAGGMKFSTLMKSPWWKGYNALLKFINIDSSI